MYDLEVAMRFYNLLTGLVRPYLKYYFTFAKHHIILGSSQAGGGWLQIIRADRHPRPLFQKTFISGPLHDPVLPSIAHSHFTIFLLLIWSSYLAVLPVPSFDEYPSTHTDFYNFYAGRHIVIFYTAV